MHLSLRVRRLVSRLLIAPLLVGPIACGNPAAPTLTTDTFNGTLSPPVNGQYSSASFQFKMKSGAVTVSVTSITPLSTITVGIALGIVQGQTCSGFEVNSAARAGFVAIADTLPSGTYCVAIYDVGNITQDVTFGLAVEYPK
jgi:hypothetical protein